MSHPYLKPYLNRYQHTAAQWIERLHLPTEKLKQAIVYSLSLGGKRIRPLLVYVTSECLHLKPEHVDAMALSIELMHTYSLIHDDLPAMDNDDFRRGQPSCHRAFDEATAILAGDALHSLSITLMLEHYPTAITQQLLHASGAFGMISGQMLDMSLLYKSNATEESMEHIHQLKTGALLNICIALPLTLSDANEAMKIALSDIADRIGFIFQLQDDYLDHYAAPHALGKFRSSDIENNKVTFASLYSEPELKDRILSSYNDIKCRLSRLPTKSTEGFFALIEQLEQRMPL